MPQFSLPVITDNLRTFVKWCLAVRTNVLSVFNDKICSLWINIGYYVVWKL